MANFMQMMAKAQQVKKKMEAMQEKAGLMEVEGTAGGAVTCRMNGKFELQAIKISASAVNANEVDLLEDLILAAVNDARAKAEKQVGDETQKIMSEMGLPPGMGLPF